VGRRSGALLSVVCALQVLLCLPVETTATDAVDRGEAAGDVSALTVNSGHGSPRAAGLGPMAPARAEVPPTPVASQRTGTQGCGSGGAPACPAPVRSLQVTDDAVVATLQTGRRGCFAGAMTPGGVLAPPAAASCDAIEHVEIASGLVTIVADAVDSRSTTQACSRPVGWASVASLRVAGLPAVPVSRPLTPNTTVVLPPGASGATVVATAVLDEQIPDPNGAGLTVNAIHLRGGPALAAGAGLDVVIGHTYSRATCPHLTLQQEAVPGGEMTFAVVDPAVFPLDAAVVGGGTPACFAGDRRGNGCMEPIAAMLARSHALLGVTANYTDWIHVLGTVIVDHHAWTPVDPHTTSLCIGDGLDPGAPLVRVVKTADAGACRAAISAQRVVTAGRPQVEGLSDAGHHGRFWWSTRPPVAEPRALVGVRGDGTVVIALATATRPGVEGGISQPDAVRWLIAHGVVDGIEMDGGGQGDMVVAPDMHVVPLEGGVPGMQVTLLIDPPGSQAAAG
jgi:hypothetical protein